MIKEKTKS